MFRLYGSELPMANLGFWELWKTGLSGACRLNEFWNDADLIVCGPGPGYTDAEYREGVDRGPADRSLGRKKAAPKSRL